MLAVKAAHRHELIENVRIPWPVASGVALRYRAHQLIPRRHADLPHPICSCHTNAGSKGPGSGFAKIFLNDAQAFMRPAESDRAIDKTALQLRAFLMMPHLVHGGLADVNVSELSAMQ
ncbi:hypothetical protein [Mesorhizobium sp. M0491]|uniref:hypothetical protein n=1 Tax=Mesorhizobium sp. M0491 TaxID=2956950 RepID=UPI00333B3BF8